MSGHTLKFNGDFMEESNHALPEPRPYMGTYDVHATGRVFSHSGWRGQTYKEIKQTPDEYGYPCVRLMIGGKRKRLRVHYLVASAFHGPKPSPMHQVRHLDGNKENNHYANLKWGSALENAEDREHHGRTSRGLKHASRVIAGQNARLIAAAPDMLEALRKCIAALEKADTADADFGEQGDAIHAAITALAKAEGRE